jgi:hypothetical protein
MADMALILRLTPAQDLIVDSQRNVVCVYARHVVVMLLCCLTYYMSITDILLCCLTHQPQYGFCMCLTTLIWHVHATYVTTQQH